MIILMVLQLTLVAHSSQVNAETDLTGFINAVGGYATERTTLGYEADTATFNQDSSIGVQISQDISPKITATGQLVAKGAHDFETKAAWAYLTYRLSDSARFRMGRFRAPFFMYSDFLNVGYAQHWIRAPDEVYGLQFDSVNGVDLSYSMSLGRLDSKIQMYFGSSQDTFNFTRQDAALEVRLREQMGVIGTLNYGWLTARLSFHQATHMTIDNFAELPLPSPLHDIAGLRDAIMAFDAVYDLGAHADFLIEHLDVRDVAVEFSEAAIRMQWAHFFLLGEGTLLTFNDSPLAKQRRHLVSAGTNWHDITLYAIYARANDEPVNLTSSLPNVAEAANLRAALHQLTQSLSLESETITAGLRYDLDPGVAFKFEVSENTVPQQNQSKSHSFWFSTGILMRIKRPAYISSEPMFKLLGLILFSLAWGTAASADIVLATHSENPLRTLEMADARRIFLKQTNEFPDGNKVKVAILDKQSETRRVFETQVLKMSPSQIKTYWASFIFSGQNRPPREFASEDIMKKWIAATPGALGYLDVNEVDDTIKVLATIPGDNDR